MDNSDIDITQYIETILHFCIKRLNDRQNAEDLAGEIMVHILSRLRKYKIEKPEKWIWSIVHNRYAKYINKRNKSIAIDLEADYLEIVDTYDFIDELIISNKFQQIFNVLHKLSNEYREILLDYYINDLHVKQIAEKNK
jgi:RNA polymerase sigma factor (sigma-70 family)